jgi:hypothetical protein
VKDPKGKEEEEALHEFILVEVLLHAFLTSVID